MAQCDCRSVGAAHWKEGHGGDVMNGRSVKLTPLRLAALRYAAGEDDIQPTYAVARPLELAGLIVWTVHRDNRITSDMKRRGWQITARGKRCSPVRFERAITLSQHTLRRSGSVMNQNSEGLRGQPFLASAWDRRSTFSLETQNNKPKSDRTE